MAMIYYPVSKGSTNQIFPTIWSSQTSYTIKEQKKEVWIVREYQCTVFEQDQCLHMDASCKLN